jgi:hypothetical protein
MKKILLLLSFALIFATISAQKRQVLFFHPVPSNLFSPDVSSTKVIQNASVWLFRPTAGVIATRNTYDKASKTWNTKALSAVAIFGVGYQHFIEVDGKPFNNLGFNLLLLTDTEDSRMGIGLFGTYFGLINLGVDYNFGLKNFGIDTGITLKF